MQVPFDDQQTVRRPGRGLAEAYALVTFTVTHGPDLGKSIRSASGQVSIGTAADNDLVLSDPTVSRHHCLVNLAEGGLVVRDVNSTNGVSYRGCYLKNAMLSVSTAALTIGDTQVTVTIGEEGDAEASKRGSVSGLIGDSEPMRRLLTEVLGVAATNLAVLIEGETGSGKEVVAEAIHRSSARADKNFVVFDCGAVSPTVIESELFGHEKGAFTGAVVRRSGVFEQASGGTLFLDELGELPLALQPKLLRALEKKEIKRVGGNQVIPVDIRLISASNRNLAACVREDTFREDLFFRVSGAHIKVPPLRTRVSDLRALATHFLAQLQPPVSPEELPEHLWEMFASYRWPGNVREFKNVVQRIAAMPHWSPELKGNAEPAANASRDGSEATAVENSGDASHALAPLPEARRQALDEFERMYLRSALERTDGNISGAARIAGVSRQMIQKLLRKHGAPGA